MSTTIKKIALNDAISHAINLKFLKTNVYKRVYGNKTEELLFSYSEELSTIYKSELTGMYTLINLEFPELFAKFSIFRYLEGDTIRILAPLPDFEYKKNDDYQWEFVSSSIDNFLCLIFTTQILRNKNGFSANISVAHDECVFRIELLEPLNWCFEES